MTLDVARLIRLDVSVLELIVRTSAVYLGLLLALRVFGRREMGSLELPELLMVVLLADGVQNGMAGAYESLTGALIVAGTLVGWNYALSVLAYRVALVRTLLRPEPLRLVENGRTVPRNMARELVTEDELRSHLRLQGVEDVREVKVAYLEPDGAVSVIKDNTHDDGSPPRRPRAAAS